MRYVDLIVNPQVKDAFVKRTQLVNSMETVPQSKGLPGSGKHPFYSLYTEELPRVLLRTHHNTLDMTLYLRIRK
jgi:lysyl-tRNA synthetase class 2